MSNHIDFYFDFASPYAYLSSNWIDQIAKDHQATVAWKPFLLGAVFKAEGTQPLVAYPNKGHYSLHDMARTARLDGIDFQMPEPFPFMSVAACRAFYATTDDEPALAVSLAKAIMRNTFSTGISVASADQVLEVANGLGMDRQKLEEAMQSQDIKDRLRDETDKAINEHRIFGSPFFLVNGEAFWGNDKRGQIEAWLEKGGW